MKSFFTNLLTVLISLFVIMLISEVFIKNFYPQLVLPRYMEDSGFGIRVPMPNKSYRHFSPGDFDVLVNTNSVGMRGIKEFTLEKPVGIKRVCILGDSFTFGYGVADHEIFSELLGKGREQSYEFLNFGVSGFGQASELILWRNKVKNYQCDMVINMYFNNDPGNNVISSLFDYANGVLVRNDSSYLPGISVQKYLYGIPVVGDYLAQSHLWSLFRNVISRFIHKEMLNSKGLSSYEDLTESTLSITQALLLKMEDEVVQTGADFYVFVIPQADRINNGVKSNFKFILKDDSKIINQIEKFAPDDYWFVDEHWTQSGHAKAASLLGKALSI